MSVKMAYHPYALPLSHSHHHHHHHSTRPRPRRQSAHELGASAAYPIVISPPAAAAEHEPAHEHAPWNAPQHALPLEAFSWPSMWFDVPSVSPPAAAPTLAGIFAPQYDLLDALPELDHSKTPPDSSPASLHDACTTPPQDSGRSGARSTSANVVATCDVPLVAPRPLPFASPTFLQFDSLPDEDEDLSFPPYTHSRRLPASERGAQNPRKRPAPPLPPPAPSCDADSALLPSISKKQRRARAEPAVFVDGGGGAARHRIPQLVRFGHNGAMGWI